MDIEPNLHLVKSEELSTDKEDRFVLIDVNMGKVVDDCQGHGFLIDSYVGMSELLDHVSGRMVE